MITGVFFCIKYFENYNKLSYDRVYLLIRLEGSGYLSRCSL